MKTYIVYTWNNDCTDFSIADEIEARTTICALVKYLFKYFHLGATLTNSFVAGLKSPAQD